MESRRWDAVLSMSTAVRFTIEAFHVRGVPL